MLSDLELKLKAAQPEAREGEGEEETMGVDQLPPASAGERQ